MTKPTTFIDLRSDTVTRPTPAMRQAMFDAEVGDDVFGDDPTVNALQQRVAKMLGKEAALFVPSGTMANQTSIRAQTQAGDEIIAHEDSHIVHYEAGGPAALSGCSLRLVQGALGLFDAVDVEASIRSTDSHYPQSSLIVIENTHNRGSGTPWPIGKIEAIKRVADECGLRMHLDGARLMNAHIATGVSPAEYAKCFDTVAMCFSKGLGAPVGSIVAASAETIQRIHRFRKMFGGAMRQVGVLAAAATYALDHHVERLADDHANAKNLAVAVNQMPGVGVELEAVQTNLVYIDVQKSTGTAASLRDELEVKGVRMLSLAPQSLRAVTHLDVSSEDIDRAIVLIRSVLEARSRA